MGYKMANGQWANTLAVNLSPAAAITDDAVSSVVELGDRGTLRLVLSVSAITGSDTLDVDVETSPDGTNWYVAGSFTQVTAAPTVERKAFAVDRFVRANFDVTDAGGGASVTFTLSGDAA